MYACDRCGKLIAVTKADPLAFTSLGRMHYACMNLAFHEKRNRRSDAQTRRRQRETTSETSL